MTASADFRRCLFAALAFVVALCAASALVHCGPPPEPRPLPTYSPTSCRDACDHAASLCGPSTLKPRTGSCLDVCVATESNGGDFRTGCLSAAVACLDVQRCSQ